METLRHVYTYTRMCTHAQDLCAHASCMHTHTRGMRVHARVPETRKERFYALKLGLE